MKSRKVKNKAPILHRSKIPRADFSDRPWPVRLAKVVDNAKNCGLISDGKSHIFEGDFSFASREERDECR
jgi:hypothetical protein